MRVQRPVRRVAALLAVAFAAGALTAGGGPKKGKAAVTFPPALPGGKEVVTDRSDDFLKPPATLRDGVAVAKTAPRVDFLFYPGQTYEGRPWSAWGDSLAVNGKYYAAIGDHLAPAGNAFVY